MPPLLSILIPTIVSRAAYFEAIDAQLAPQIAEGTPYHGQVEILTDCDNGEESIGEKRNRLLAMAQGKYTAFVDDDDEVSPDYVVSIIEAMATDPDVITFKMDRYVDGVLDGHQTMRLGNAYVIEGFGEPLLRYSYPPTHLCPMRRSIVGHMQFPFCDGGEDTIWQDCVGALLKTEAHIGKVLYKYLYRSVKQNEVRHCDFAYRDAELDRQIETAFNHMMAFAQ